MAKYKLTSDGVKDTERECYIPNSEGNMDWQEYLEWAKENTPDPEVTAEEEIIHIQQDEIMGLEKSLKHTDRALLKLVVGLAVALIGNSVITKDEIGIELVDLAQDLKAKLDSLESKI